MVRKILHILIELLHNLALLQSRKLDNNTIDSAITNLTFFSDKLLIVGKN